MKPYCVRAKKASGRTVTYHATLNEAMAQVRARTYDPLVTRVTLARW